MAAIVKTKLKAAREAFTQKDYERAQQASAEVLEYEPDNYNANVFLGLALLNLKKTEDSERAYRKATALSPEQPLAWQGLSQLYDQACDWAKYTETLEHLAQLYAKAGDATKCAENLQRLIDFRRDPQRSTRMQLADALSLSFYPTLFSSPCCPHYRYPIRPIRPHRPFIPCRQLCTTPCP